VARARLLIAAVLALAGCALRPGDAVSAGPPGEGTVVRPIDGDTVVVRIGGHDEHVRLIGIDTPESVSRQVPVECYGPEAKHRTAELLPAGTRVRLERDVEARDAYDRLLAYLTRADDGTFVNLLLVEEGYAESFPFPPNTAHQAELDRAQADAQAAQRGLWPACGGTDTPLAAAGAARERPASASEVGSGFGRSGSVARARSPVGELRAT
jgi:micrococcal nuclease